MPTKTWISGESLVAADMNSYLQNQVVSTWSTVAARNTAIPTPTVGMMSFLNDTQALQIYVGTAWKNLPYGMLGWSQITADSANTGSAQLVIAGLSVTFQQAGLGRRIKATAKANIYCDTANQLVRLYIKEGSVILNTAWTAVTSAGHSNIGLTAVVAPSQGTHIYDVALSADVGNARVVANPDAPALLVVEDIG